jgi:RNA polymerase sigma-70 factor (ECF subfamily)
MNLSEQELLAGAQRFDLDILAVIYDRYQPRMYTYAMRLLGDPCLAEDCVADTFLRFLKALQSGNGLQAYLYRIAHNWITDTYRRQPPPELNLDQGLQCGEMCHPDVQAERNLLQEEMRAALYRLTPEQRLVVVLRFFEGCSIESVAAALHKPTSAIKALQHRALATLGRLLLSKGEKENDHVPGKRDRSAPVKVV